MVYDDATDNGERIQITDTDKGGDIMLRTPFLFSPVGWVILGVTGYLLYQSGKKAAKREREEQNKPESSTKPAVTKKPATA